MAGDAARQMGKQRFPGIGLPSQSSAWPDDSGFLAKHSCEGLTEDLKRILSGEDADVVHPAPAEPQAAGVSPEESTGKTIVVHLEGFTGNPVVECSGQAWPSKTSVSAVVQAADKELALRGKSVSQLLRMPTMESIPTSLVSLEDICADEAELTCLVELGNAEALGNEESQGEVKKEAQEEEDEDEEPTWDERCAALWEELRDDALRGLRSGKLSRPQLQHLDKRPCADELQPRGYELPSNLGGGPRLIGGGAFGRVIKIRRGEQLLAMKRQPLGNFDAWTIPMMREVSILNAVKGEQNIVQIVDVFIAKPNKIGEVWVVMELYESDLHAELERTQFLDFKLVMEIIFNVLQGILSLHSLDIVHRDIKPENVLIELSPRLRVALCDFGVSRSVSGFKSKSKATSRTRSTSSSATATDPAQAAPCPPPPERPQLERKFTETVGTCCWRAPEMWGFADMSQMVKRDLKSLDIFATGLIWAQMLAGRRPIDYHDEYDPPEFLLFELLMRVDQPETNLNQLGFTRDMADFAQTVLSQDKAEIIKRLSWRDSAEQSRVELRDELLKEGVHPMKIHEWIQCSREKYKEPRLDAEDPLKLIADATCFDYRKRPSVKKLLREACFEGLRCERPETADLLKTKTISTPDSPANHLAATIEKVEEVIAKHVNDRPDTPEFKGVIADAGSLPPEPLPLNRASSNDVRKVFQAVQELQSQVADHACSNSPKQSSSGQLEAKRW